MPDNQQNLLEWIRQGCKARQREKGRGRLNRLRTSQVLSEQLKDAHRHTFEEAARRVESDVLWLRPVRD